MSDDFRRKLSKERNGFRTPAQQLNLTFFALRFLLDGWYQFTREHLEAQQNRNPQLFDAPKNAHRHLGADLEHEVMTSIPFEKLGVFLKRIWDKLYDQTGRILIEQENAELPFEFSNSVSFPLPFCELPDKHGRRLAIPHPSKPKFLINVLHELQTDLGKFNHFEILAPDGRPTTSPSDYRTIVKVGAPLTNHEDFLKPFSAFEKIVLRDLRNCIKRLDLEQIRALGVHENAAKTREDIEGEFKSTSRFIKSLRERLKEGSDFQQEAMEILEFSQEAWRKVYANRANYEKAIQIVMNESTDPVLRDSLSTCQSRSSDIWDSDQVLQLKSACKRSLHLAQYFCAIGHFQFHISERSISARATRLTWYDHTWKEACDGLKGLRITDLPFEFDSVFIENSNRIHPSLVQKFDRTLESFVPPQLCILAHAQ